RERWPRQHLRHRPRCRASTGVGGLVLHRSIRPELTTVPGRTCIGARAVPLTVGMRPHPSPEPRAAAGAVAAPTELLTLAPASAAPRRSAFPLFAGIVPVLGGLGLWWATGSVFALWFAALGPVVSGAAL